MGMPLLAFVTGWHLQGVCERNLIEDGRQKGKKEEVGRKWLSEERKLLDFKYLWGGLTHLLPNDLVKSLNFYGLFPHL